MNYQMVYKSLIDRRKAQSPSGYSERHHVIPKSLGGDNSRENIVSLTAREHYFCHKLLARIYGGKMWQALFLMSHGSVTSASGVRISSRDYSIAREMASREKSIAMTGSSSISGEMNPSADKSVYRFSHSDHGVVSMKRSELCERFSLSVKGISKIVTAEAKSYKGWCFHGLDSESTVTEHKKKRSSLLGSRLSESHIKALVEAKKKQIDVICPFCGVKGKGSVMNRWHFDRCKAAR